MVIVIFGESCTGKSTLAEAFAKALGATVYTGKDYLRLAKNEAIAAKLFEKKLMEAVTGAHIVYVIAQKEHLALIPTGAVRILVTAPLEIIKQRFAQRMQGNLPVPVAAMLERNHGCFDLEPHDYHVVSGETDVDAVVKTILGG